MVALTVTLKQAETDQKIINLCLDGLTYATQLLGKYQLDIPRDAFVSSLKKFTQLDKKTGLSIKSILCIKRLLYIGKNHGNYLRKSWKYILKCLSQLDDLQTMASGAEREKQLFKTNGNAQTENQMIKQIELSNSLILREHISSSIIDDIFN